MTTNVRIGILAALVFVTSGLARGAVPATAPKGPLAGAALAKELEARFGIWFVGRSLPEWASVQLPEKATAEEAIKLLRAAVEANPQLDPARNPDLNVVLRVASPEVIKSLEKQREENRFRVEEVPGADHKLFAISPLARAAPVYLYGSDPEKIAISDHVITQVIPLRSIEAVRTTNDLLPFTSGAISSTSLQNHNCVIVTDTSAKIHRLVEIIGKLDAAPRGGLRGVQFMQLKNAQASDVAKALNTHFAPPVGEATGSPTPRLYADYDARTNTVILNGPQAQVDEGLALCKKMDEAAATITAPATRNDAGNPR